MELYKIKCEITQASETMTMHTSEMMYAISENIDDAMEKVRKEYDGEKIKFTLVELLPGLIL